MITPEQLREARKKLGFSRQIDFAQQIGIGSQPTISGMENGETDYPITERTILLLARLIRDGKMSRQDAVQIINEYLHQSE